MKNQKMIWISMAILTMMATTTLAYQTSCEGLVCTATLEASEILADVTLTTGSSNAIQMKWNTSLIPENYTNPELCLYWGSVSGDAGDITVDIARIQNGWDELSSVAEINAQSIIHSDYYNNIGVLLVGTTTCIDINYLLQSSINDGHDEFTLRFGKDWMWFYTPTSVTDNAGLAHGLVGASYTAEDRENTLLTGNTPYITLSYAGLPELPYRPACADPATITNKPWNVTDFWVDGTITDTLEGPVVHGNYTLCYVNESTMFIQYDWGTRFDKLHRDWEDIYSTEIGGQSNALKARDGFDVHFEYYFPSDNGVCHNQEDSLGSNEYYATQKIFLNNVDYSDANCGECEDFLDAQYFLNSSETTCDEWHVFDVSSNDFENEFGKFDRLVSFGFQFANVYVKDVWFTRGGVFYQLY